MRVRPTTRRMSLALALLPLLLLIAAPNTRAQDSVSSEYLIKAGFMYNFANLVQWPASSFAQSDSSITIAILGEDHFGPVLDRVLEGKKVNGRSFVIRRLRSISELQKMTGNPKDCQILYVSSSEIAHEADVLQMVKGAPILTIGEIPGFARSGGIINLVLEDNRVRFEVNVDAAKQSDLSISSRLLALARIVQTTADGRKAE
jgi:uncharacterized protein DUF4154